MDKLTNEQNFQLTQAIDLIDYLADEILISPDSEPAIDVEVFNTW